MVLHESIKPSTDKDERKFYVVNRFKDITYWNWDKIPSKNDPFIKAFDWIDIAEAVSFQFVSVCHFLDDSYPSILTLSVGYVKLQSVVFLKRKYRKIPRKNKFLL